MEREALVSACQRIITAYKDGTLGQTRMPEDTNPGTSLVGEERIAFFTLPMALNYQRDSYALWEAVQKTFEDPETRFVFDVAQVSAVSEEEVRTALLKHRVALQPNKHVRTWQTIATSVHSNWGSFTAFLEATQKDFLRLRTEVQVEHKKEFPYLSGPKIFNYWSFILSTYGGVSLANRDYIDIAPDTHITKCSVRLGVITEEEAAKLPKEEIAKRWRELLVGSGIAPIDLHSPFWFWSRNGFIFDET